MHRTSGSLGRFAATAAFIIVFAAPAHAGSDYLLELGGVQGETSDDKHKNQIEILSYSWGATRAPGKADARTDGLMIIRNNTEPAPAKGEKGGTEDINIGVGELQEANKDMPLKGSTIGENTPAAAGGVRVAVGDVNGDGRADIVSPRDAASGLPTGKRQHKPMMLTAPLAKGSLTVRGSFPGCAVGTRYPSIKLGGRGKRYTLQDAIITSCGRSSTSGDALPMEEVSFNYGKIRW
jgi:type VI protein secretion system component Hcp